ncbi:hypothetical protein SALWKB12_0092 [Snodgrassella communis]|nr:hypothetical protein SALWKB12_0092 [Snodgrassella communis]
MPVSINVIAESIVLAVLDCGQNKKSSHNWLLLTMDAGYF